MLFNHEPQWHLLDRFERARRRVFYALHYGKLYDKEGSWESVRAPVDLQLANSNWTADQIFAETGHRPDRAARRREPRRVPAVSRARSGTRSCAAASSSGRGRAPTRSSRRARCSASRWSATRARTSNRPRSAASTRRRACSRSGAGSRASASPGLEALACAAPLVTTDNGGCREYAIDGETALVVPPRDARAMADAIRRLLDDDALAARLVANGLEVVERDFDWERRTDEFEAVLDGLSAEPGGGAAADAPGRAGRARAVGGRARLGQPPLHPAVRRLGAAEHRRSLRARDRRQRLGVGGGELRARRGRPRRCSTTPTSGSRRGMNQGLAAARGTLRRVLQQRHDRARRVGRRTCCRPRGAIRTRRSSCPAVTETRNPVNVRTEPGDRRRGAPAVQRAARGDRLRHAGRGRAPARSVGRGVRDRERRRRRPVLQGVGERPRRRLRPARARAARREGLGVANLDDWQGLWARNRRRFLEKWMGDGEVPRLDVVRSGALRAQPRDVARRSRVGWTATSRCAIAKIAGCGASSPRTARCARTCSVGRTPDGAACGPACPARGREPARRRRSHEWSRRRARVARGQSARRRRPSSRAMIAGAAHSRPNTDGRAAGAERHRPHRGEDRARRGDQRERIRAVRRRVRPGMT